MAVFGRADLLEIHGIPSIAVRHGNPEQTSGFQIPKAFRERSGTFRFG
jgi:hypothetical protein